MSTKQQNRMKPGEFKFTPVDDWIVVEQIKIESKYDKSARRANLNIYGGPPPKNIMEYENQKAKELLTYEEYTKEALSVFEGKHGFQGVIKAIGPTVEPNRGFKIGDKVYFRGNSGEFIVHNKQLFLIMRPHEIYGSAPKDEFKY